MDEEFREIESPESAFPDEPKRPLARPGPGLPAAFGWLLLLVAAQNVAGIAVYILLAMIGFGEFAIPVVFALVTLITLVMASILIAVKYDRTASAQLAIRFPYWAHFALVALLIFPLFLALAGGTEYLALAFRWAGAPNWMIEIPGVQETLNSIAQMPPGFRTAFVLVFFGIVPGVGEELFFRGYIGRGLIARWGPWMGVLFSSLLFGLVHIHPLQAAFAAAMGVVLHAVYLWTRSLLAPMLVHAAYNSIAIFWTLASDPQADNRIPNSQFLIALFVSLAIGLLLYFIRAKRGGSVIADRNAPG